MLPFSNFAPDLTVAAKTNIATGVTSQHVQRSRPGPAAATDDPDLCYRSYSAAPDGEPGKGVFKYGNTSR